MKERTGCAVNIAGGAVSHTLGGKADESSHSIGSWRRSHSK
ncbi:hypothetical protein GYO_4068 [Bacillus spizizenii TU-B-10]|uniref:Uncharacterized protein n=1 Tax=Bacillus spizizenii (strain DSM 15029 / JCM 12233 / NBRC 101239 / NRRL B-23049 / TU-B-10) TaxID=1052585 RepID=G4P1V9_BACS4|nr:hypothetical protein GYO_4068 [Bacillus spizizenii TU-B-10]SCV38436.1 hypothetical protein BQ1740_0440 [Bacillus subtilis]